MAVRQKASKWYADFVLQGKRYREFGFDTPGEAEAWELEARAALLRGKPLPFGPKDTRAPPASADVRTIEGLVNHVVKVRWASMKSRVSEETARLYVRWTGPLTHTVDALSANSIHDYVAHLRDTGRSGSTINRHLAAISRLMHTAISLNLIARKVELPRQREGEGRIRWFTEEEEAALLLTLRQWGAHRELDLFIFLADTGARLGEARKLEWVDIASQERSVTFWETKAGNHRTVPLTERARAALRGRRLAEVGKSGPFQSINASTLRSLWDRLRTHHPFLQNAVVHTFRHTCASRLVQNGVDIMRVRMWMGHKAIATTLRYAHLAPRHLDDVLKVLEGGGSQS